MKDLGLRVVLVDWEKAFKTNVKFGTQQAIIYSSKSNAESVEGSISRWLGSHPFTLTSLESKGLEFDDVMVAFDFENKFWNVASKSVDSLRLLRELYVAVTRARRRVVVLVKKRVPAMASFFENLNLNLDTLVGCVCVCVCVCVHFSLITTTT